MKRKDLARRAASAAMAACMMFTLSAPALAESTDALMQLSMASRSAVSVLDAENGDPIPTAPALQLNIANGSIEVYFKDGKQYAKQGDNEQQCDSLAVTSNGVETSNTLTIKGGNGVAANVALNNVNIEASGAAVAVSGDVELTLEGTNVLVSGNNCAGLQKNDDGQLTIDGIGSLEAYGGNQGAGIGAGSSNNRCARNITINGGTINAHGGSQGAGIGGCNSSNNTDCGIAQNITINDGTVNAYGGDEAAGIGGGGAVNSDNDGARGINITINGGIVSAEAGSNAAAIGGGANALGYDITITGGTVTVKENDGKWIGGRDQGNSKEIDFSDTAATITYLDKNGKTVDQVKPYGITITGDNVKVAVTSKNCTDILGDGTLSYDPENKKLTLKDADRKITKKVSIDAPDTDVVLIGNDSVANKKLTITNAKDVTLSSQSAAAIASSAEINCTGVLTIKTADSTWAAVSGDLTVKGAASVQVESVGGHAVEGNLKITPDCSVVLKNDGTSSVVGGTVTYTPGTFVYYTSDAQDAGFVDPRLGDAPSGYARIEKKTLYNITADDANIKLQGTETTLKSAFEGEEVTVTAAGRENAEFTGWTAEGITLSDDQKAQNPVTFKMQGKNVTLTPSYKQYYTITSTDDVTIKVGSDTGTKANAKALEGQHIVALANKKDGYVFENWTVDGVTLNTSTSVNYTNFEMPANNVTLTPNYAKVYGITVNGGNFTVNGKAATEAKTGDTVAVTATDAPKGQVFDGWEVSGDIELAEGATLADENITFTMKESDVTLTAKYKTKYNIAVDGGSFTVNGIKQKKAVKGDTIAATADSAPAGQKFSNWEISDNITLAEGVALTDETITFTMPEGNVSLKAVFKTLHNVTVHDGTADLTSAIEGEKVTITATPADGEVFDHWIVSKGDVTLVDETSASTSFEMTDAEAVITAVYKTQRDITVHDGTASVKKQIVTKALPGDEVTIKPKNIKGKRFVDWDVPTNVHLTKMDNGVAKFTMPDTAVEISALYKTLYSVQVDKGTASPSEAIEGETVTITAPEKVEGKVFDRWEVNAGGVTVANEKETTTTFTMPNNAVVITAVYNEPLNVTVNGDVVTTALPGESVTVKADEIPGKRFNHWEDKSGNTSLNKSALKKATITFNMPQTAVELEAVYDDLYAVTAGNDFTTVGVPEAIEGETVAIKAAERTGYTFVRWEIKTADGTAITPADPDAMETSFTMPKGAVTVTAKYNREMTLTVNNGNGTTSKTVLNSGTKSLVPVTADEVEGKVFKGWKVVSGEDKMTLAEGYKLTDKTIEFNMQGDVELTAEYNTIHSINTTFCTADPASAIVGTEITVTAKEREGYEFDGWEIKTADGTTITPDDPDAMETSFTMPDDDVTVEAKYKQYHNINVLKGMIVDADGNPIDVTSAVEGTEIWVKIDTEQRDPEEFEFNRWESTPDGLIENKNNELTSFIMPDEDVTVEAKFLHLRQITVNDGTTYVEGEEGGIAKAGQTITVKPEEIEGLRFTYWSVDSENVTTLEVVDKDTGEATFTMVNEPVELTAHYEAMVTVSSDPAKADEDPETYWLPVDETGSITAPALDEETFPGMVFDHWEVVSGEIGEADLQNQNITFTVPKSAVELVAHWKSGAMDPIVNPDEPLDPGYAVEPADDGSGAAGAAVVGVAIGGAAIWGGYEITTRAILNDLLPEGAAIPANRGELAALIWAEKGKPEPAAQPAFTDVADTELAKAAQWCVEQGYLEAKDGKFDPDGWMPKYKTIEVWKNAFPKK